MANQLRMATVDAILALHQLGWSQRRIAREFGIDRETVGRYVHSRPAGSKPATNAIPRSEAVPAAVPGAKSASNPIPGPESLCEPYRAVIEAKVQQGLTGQRI